MFGLSNILRNLFSPKRPRRDRDTDPVIPLFRHADELDDLDRRIGREPHSADIEDAEDVTRRLLRCLLKDTTYQSERFTSMAGVTSLGRLASALHSWLLLPDRTSAPDDLIQIVRRLACAGRALAVNRKTALFDSKLARHRGVPVSEGTTAQEFATDICRWLADPHQSPTVRLAQDLSNGVRNLTLWPAEVSTDSCTATFDSVRALRSIAEEISQFRSLYEAGRNAEVAAENLGAMSQYLQVWPPARPLPIKTCRIGRISNGLRELGEKATAQADSGFFASGVCKYAHRVFQTLAAHWKTSLASGTALIVPAAALEQWLIWFSTKQDVSWANTLNKLDPVDGFKLPLAATTITVCLISVWASFSRIRGLAIKSFSNPKGIAAFGTDRSVFAYIFRNMAVTGGAWIVMCCAAAGLLWSGALHNLAASSPLASAHAEGVPSTTNSVTGLPLTTLNGFQSVVTFGNVRVLRCLQPECTLGSATFHTGDTLSVPTDKTLLNATSGSNARVEIIGVGVPTEEATIIALPYLQPERNRVVDVSGTLALTGIPSSPTTVAMNIDDKSVNAMAEAIGKALEHIHSPAAHISVGIDTSSLKQPLSDLVAAIKAEPAWPEKFLSSVNTSAGALASISDMERKRWLCEKNLKRRNILSRTDYKLEGVDCDSMQ